MSKSAGGWPAIGRTAQELLKANAPVRGTRALLRMNQDDGFDCPGCAWPEPKHASRFEFCENGAKAIAAEATTRTVDAAFFAKYTVSELRERDDYWLEQQGRLAEPMRYDAVQDRYVPVSWYKAFQIMGGHLQRLANPDRAVFYTSGRTSNEAAFLYQLFARELGTNNLPDCSNMCHESSGESMGESVGIGKGTVTIDDFYDCDLVLVIGQNPGTNHPRMLAALQAVRKRGATIVAINPLRETGLVQFIHPQQVGAMLTNSGSPIATHYLQPLIGGDMALITGLIKAVVAAESYNPGTVFDHEFIKEHTTGIDAVLAQAEGSDWESIETESGISREAIEELAGLFVSSQKVIACWAMGLTQHRHAVPTLQQLINLMLMRGMVGKPGLVCARSVVIPMFRVTAPWVFTKSPVLHFLMQLSKNSILHARGNTALMWWHPLRPCRPMPWMYLSAWAATLCRPPPTAPTPPRPCRNVH